MENSKPLERSAVLAILPPIAATAERTSGYADFRTYQSGEIKVLVGDASATGTLTILRATSSTGASSASVATAAYGGTGTVGDDFVHRLTIKQSDLDDDPTRPYFAVILGGGVALAAAIIEGHDPRYAPATSIAKVTDAR